MARMTKKEINSIRAATFTEIKKILNEDWETLPEFFHIYDFVDKYGNHNYCAKGRQVAYDANIYKEVKEIFTINKKTKQAWEGNKW